MSACGKLSGSPAKNLKSPRGRRVVVVVVVVAVAWAVGLPPLLFPKVLGVVTAERSLPNHYT